MSFALKTGKCRLLLNIQVYCIQVFFWFEKMKNKLT